ncbi:MAG: hypothetical protein J7L43_02735 [Candidatus Aenigmarchaeota archaeon]|nr:hypothetical protein [Candidatus Aenigmarchaeota archaeon]
MHTYLEIFEDLEEEEGFTKQPVGMRIEVTDEDDALKKYEKIKKLLEEELFKNRNYTARIHFCHHEEKKPCKLKIIEKHKKK